MLANKAKYKTGQYFLIEGYGGFNVATAVLKAHPVDKGRYRFVYMLGTNNEGFQSMNSNSVVQIAELVEEYAFIHPVSKKEALAIQKLSEEDNKALYNKLKKELWVKGEVFGHNITKLGDYFVFGCGAIVLHRQELEIILPYLQSPPLPKNVREILDYIEGEEDGMMNDEDRKEEALKAAIALLKH